VAVRAAEGREALLDACLGALRSGRPALVAWSFYSSGFGEAAVDLEWLRERAAGPALLHVAGGPHATAEPAETLRAGFDLAAGGEGERTLVGLLARLGRGQSPRGRGLAWLEGGALRRGGPAEPVDLDAFPPFAPGLRRLGPIEITRGCIHACRFCQASFLFGARPRHRSVEAVAGWVRAMARRGARDVRFVTPSALAYGSSDGSPRLDRVEALLEAVREAAGPHGRIYLGSFPSEIRPEHVTPEALRLLRVGMPASLESQVAIEPCPGVCRGATTSVTSPSAVSTCRPRSFGRESAAANPSAPSVTVTTKPSITGLDRNCVMKPSRANPAAK